MTTASATDDLAITLGIEEELFLVDPETRDLLTDPDPAIFEVCERNRGPHKVVHEFLRSQIETNTCVCASVQEARKALGETRRLVVRAAEAHGTAVLASSTHPFAAWTAQMPTPKERYEWFAVTFQESVRRMLVGGMHIHAGFGDADERIRAGLRSVTACSPSSATRPVTVESTLPTTPRSSSRNWRMTPAPSAARTRWVTR